MSRMFGERIEDFVLSIDIMDSETFTGLMKLISVYVNKHLDVAYFSVLSETTIDEQQGLQTRWSTRDEGPSYTVDKGHSYASHSAYAFGNNQPIWVVCATKGPLHSAEDVKDLWAGVGDLPPYSPPTKDEVRTSVMHPITKEGRAIGVVEFASEKYVEPTHPSLEEVKTLARVISRASQMHDVRRAQHENTQGAMQKLEKALESESWARLALPQLFVAYSAGEKLESDSRAEHNAVIEIIRQVVDEFTDILEPIYWEDVDEAGNINEQVIRDICNSEFGLCYFSVPNTQGQFEDSSNVLFEAGMMQALANSPNTPLTAWIALREKSSASIPFDIASERILFVDRSDGTLDKIKFANALRQRVSALVDHSHSQTALANRNLDKPKLVQGLRQRVMKLVKAPKSKD